MPYKLTEEQAKELFREEGVENSPEIEYVEELDWDDEGKYQLGGVVFKVESNHYMLNITRSGSYHTDYYFEYHTECPEVTKKTRTIEYWG